MIQSHAESIKKIMGNSCKKQIDRPFLVLFNQGVFSAGVFLMIIVTITKFEG